MVRSVQVSDAIWGPACGAARLHSVMCITLGLCGTNEWNGREKSTVQMAPLNWSVRTCPGIRRSQEMGERRVRIAHEPDRCRSRAMRALLWTTPLVAALRAESLGEYMA